MSLSRNIAQNIIEKNIPIEDVVVVLKKYNLLSLLLAVRNDVEKLSQEGSNQERIHIESPFPLDATALARIKRIVGNDLAPYEVTINKDVLAGFKARYRGILYDGSAERIVKQFIGNS